MLTNRQSYVNIIKLFCAGVAQLVEQLICNQQVGGSNPSTSSKHIFVQGRKPNIRECTQVAKGGRL